MERATTTGGKETPPEKAADKIRRFPAAVRESFERFEAEGGIASLDPVIFAIMEDFIPRTPAQPLAELPGTTRLMDDLGFDSLAITEVVFFTEDLFGIRISNEEILQVRTLDDLVGFVRQKVSARPQN